MHSLDPWAIAWWRRCVVWSGEMLDWRRRLWRVEGEEVVIAWERERAGSVRLRVEEVEEEVAYLLLVLRVLILS